MIVVALIGLFGCLLVLWAMAADMRDDGWIS